MAVTNRIKGLVSKSKRRYQENGFDLDLTYISPNIIAMGFPAEKLEGMYRNNYDDVVRFLDQTHPDHYKVYNLCSERKYDKSRFHGRVECYPFDDHHPPQIELFKSFCEGVDGWLAQHSENVAVVHCKAGKGRTGVMVCSYLLHRRKFLTADEALQHYGDTRTMNKKGVTIPSQIRYVHYYGKLVKENLTYERIPFFLVTIRIRPVPTFAGKSCSPYFVIRHPRAKHHQSGVFYNLRRNEPFADLPLVRPVAVWGDFMIEFFNKPKMMKKESMFHFWLNSFFISKSEFMSVACADSASSFEVHVPSSLPKQREHDDQHRPQPCVSPKNVARRSSSLPGKQAFGILPLKTSPGGSKEAVESSSNTCRPSDQNMIIGHSRSREIRLASFEKSSQTTTRKFLPHESSVAACATNPKTEPARFDPVGAGSGEDTGRVLDMTSKVTENGDHEKFVTQSTSNFNDKLNKLKNSAKSFFGSSRHNTRQQDVDAIKDLKKKKQNGCHEDVDIKSRNLYLGPFVSKSADQHWGKGACHKEDPKLRLSFLGNVRTASCSSDTAVVVHQSKAGANFGLGTTATRSSQLVPSGLGKFQEGVLRPFNTDPLFPVCTELSNEFTNAPLSSVLPRSSSSSVFMVSCSPKPERHLSNRSHNPSESCDSSVRPRPAKVDTPESCRQGRFFTPTVEHKSSSSANYHHLFSENSESSRLPSWQLPDGTQQYQHQPQIHRPLHCSKEIPKKTSYPKGSQMENGRSVQGGFCPDTDHLSSSLKTPTSDVYSTKWSKLFDAIMDDKPSTSKQDSPVFLEEESFRPFRSLADCIDPAEIHQTQQFHSIGNNLIDSKAKKKFYKVGGQVLGGSNPIAQEGWLTLSKESYEELDCRDYQKQIFHVVSLKKSELDKVNKDVQNKLLPSDFQIELFFVKPDSIKKSHDNFLKDFPDHHRVEDSHDVRFPSGEESDDEADCFEDDDGNFKEWNSFHFRESKV